MAEGPPPRPLAAEKPLAEHKKEALAAAMERFPFLFPKLTLNVSKARTIILQPEVLLHVREALEQLTYLALERHHPGWEINDGASGELVIDVAEATFVLDCSLRFTATDDHSTEL